MTDATIHESHPEEPQMTDVTFRLAPPSSSRPYQWVESFATPDENWESGQEWYDPDKIESVTVELPVAMAQNLIDFAHKHIGPNATEQQVDYWCHTFAHAVGATALEVTGLPEQATADAKARAIHAYGSELSPSELAVGEHGVVGDPAYPDRGPVHSMVGIGRPKGQTDAPNLAIQVDTSKGDLYIGQPAQYLESLRRERTSARSNTQPTLYVQREPLEVPPDRQVRGRR